MRRLAAWAALALLLAGPSTGLAQQHEGHETSAASGETANENGFELWKWANFLLLVGGLGYLIRKNAGPYFATRSSEIRKQMAEAREAREDAERHAAVMKAKLAGLTAEIEALKHDALAEQQAESDRFLKQNAAALAKISAQAEQEIAAAGKQARLELKRHAAELAVGMAEKRIRADLTPAAQAALMDSFNENLKRPDSRPQAT
jgi:F-type H+-transporting ATPase subunit b